MANKHTITNSSREGLAADLHAYLGKYQAQFQRDVSVSDGHIYYSHPARKWLLVRAKGNKAFVTFHDDCPCDKM